VIVPGLIAAAVLTGALVPGARPTVHARMGPDTIVQAETGPRPVPPDPDPGEAGPSDPPVGPTGTGVSAPPGQTSGIRVAPRRGAKVLLWVPRVILFVPRHAIDIAVHPIRLGLMVWEKHQVPRRAADIFFTRDRKFGIWPVLFVETGFGANAGARLVHRDMAGKGENVFVRASYGGLYRQRYEARMGTGSRLGDDVQLSVRGSFQIVPRARFYGLGNADEGSARTDAPMDPIDPTRAVDSRYRRDEAFGEIAADFALTRSLSFRLSEEIRWRRFLDAATDDDDAQLQAVYDTRRLAGWRTGQLTSYTEGSLTVSNTRVTQPHIHPAVPSKGWLARGFVGAGIGTRGDPTRFVRYGADVQRFIDLHRGDRVLRLRGLADVVDGPLDRVVFVDMPSLGGPTLLRGYVRDRFRGRIAGLASVEYLWPIEDHVTGYLFTDVGRVWNELPLDGGPPRVGFGGGLIAHTSRAFVARLQVASSIDGGFYMQLKFSPSWEIYDD
jgi:hypothetical protein